jgi:hypothetical protein
MYNPPPADLNSRDPLIFTPPNPTLWFRSHQLAKDPVYFGKGMAYRWDAPEGDYGVLYLGADEFCAFMESIGRGSSQEARRDLLLLSTRSESDSMRDL